MGRNERNVEARTPVGLATFAAEVRVPGIGAQLVQMEKAIQENQDAIRGLAESLNDITRQSPDSDRKNDVPRDAASAVACRIRNLIQEIEFNTRLVMLLRENLDL